MQVSAGRLLDLDARRAEARGLAIGYAAGAAGALALAAPGLVATPGAVVAAAAGVAAALHHALRAHLAGADRDAMVDEAVVCGWRALLPGDVLARRERLLESQRHRRRLERALRREASSLALSPAGRSPTRVREDRERMLALADRVGDLEHPLSAPSLVLVSRLLEASCMRRLLPTDAAGFDAALARAETALGIPARP